MTTQDNSATPAGTEPAKAPRRGRRYLLIATVVGAIGLTGAVATHAFSDSGGRGHGWHEGWGGPGHWRGHGMGRFGGPIDPARATERADRMVRHLAVEIDATAEQQEKLRGIVKSALGDLLPMHEKVHAARQKARELLTQPTFDRAAIEAFRAEHIKLADETSKRLTKALGDAAEVLTPEQRQKIGEHMERRRSFFQRWRDRG